MLGPLGWSSPGGQRQKCPEIRVLIDLRGRDHAWGCSGLTLSRVWGTLWGVGIEPETAECKASLTFGPLFGPFPGILGVFGLMGARPAFGFQDWGQMSEGRPGLPGSGDIEEWGRRKSET